MSGSGDYTLTPNLGLYKPNYALDVGLWGEHLNLNADKLDAVLLGDGPFLPTSGGTIQASGDLFGLALSGGAYGGNISGTGVDGDVNLLPTGNGKVFLGMTHHYSGPAKTASWLNINMDGGITDGSTAQTVLCAISDGVDASGAQGGGMSVIRNGYNLAAGAVGGRTAFGLDFAQTGPTTLAAGLYYVGGAFFVAAAHSAGGVTGAGNARGNMFASNDSVMLRNGAGLYWNSLVGYELDIGAEAGTGIGYKQGMKIVTWGSDRVAGSGLADYAYGIAAQAVCAGWDVGYCIGSPDGWWPMKATSRLIGTAPALGGGPAYAAAWGVDFSNVTFSGGLIRGPGFVVDGNGRVTVHLDNAANDAAAATAGTGLNQLYRNGNAIQVRLT